MIAKDDIPLATRNLLQFAEETTLVRTIWALTPEQKHSKVYKDIGEQRYLSALRSGGIDNAEMTKNAFKFDLLFLNSKLVAEAARRGFELKLARGQRDVAAKIKELTGLPDELPVVAEGDSVEAKPEQST